MTIENEKIMITEIIVEETSSIANLKVRDAHIPDFINIGCIYRDPDVIIVNGETTIYPQDRLVLISTPQKQKQAIDFIQGKVEANEK
jgi:trk system potassium uptake protein TrkA